ncbi:MAG: hypothetical protein HUU21_10070 [Polyangiaceae bacterium]|nr:hypothetical protein [Polyangiaceae bacterium]
MRLLPGLLEGARPIPEGRRPIVWTIERMSFKKAFVERADLGLELG